MELFPDPSNSPFHHARCLHIGAPAITPITSPDAHAWVHSFHNLVTLWLRGHREDGGFSEVIDLTFSFPLLQDLSLFFFFSHEGLHRQRVGHSFDLTKTQRFSRAPEKCSRPLHTPDRPLHTPIVKPPGRSPLSQIGVSRRLEDSELIQDLVSRCVNTLESLQLL